MQAAVATNGNGAVTDYEPLVLKAIADGYRTLGAIKRHTGFPIHKDISELLDGLITDNKIHKQDNGTIAAYFLWKENPIRFWLDGDGKVEAEFGNQSPEPKKRGRKPKAEKPDKPKRKYTRRASKEIVARATEPKASPEPAVEAKPAPAEGPVHSRYVTLSSGAQLVVGFSGSIFDLTEEEFSLITDISARLREFEGVE